MTRRSRQVHHHGGAKIMGYTYDITMFQETFEGTHRS